MVILGTIRVSDLVPGEKYCASCFNGEKCTFVSIEKQFDDYTAAINVSYNGKLYLASSYQLYNKY
jgi:hypothetical protein